MSEFKGIESISKFFGEAGTFFLATEDGKQPKTRPVSFQMLVDGKIFDKAVKVLPLLAQIYNEQTGLKTGFFYLKDAKAEYSNMVDYSLKKEIEL